MVSAKYVVRWFIMCAMMALGVNSIEAYSQVTVWNCTYLPIAVGLYLTQDHRSLYIAPEQFGDYRDPEGRVTSLIVLLPGHEVPLPNFDLSLKALKGVQRDVLFSKKLTEFANILGRFKPGGKPANLPSYIKYINVGSTKSQVFIGFKSGSKELAAYGSQADALASTGMTLEALKNLSKDDSSGIINVQELVGPHAETRAEALFDKYKKLAQKYLTKGRTEIGAVADPKSWPKAYIKDSPSFQEVIQILKLDANTMLLKSAGSKAALQEAYQAMDKNALRSKVAYYLMYRWLNPHAHDIKALLSKYGIKDIGEAQRLEIQGQLEKIAGSDAEAIRAYVYVR